MGTWKYKRGDEWPPYRSTLLDGDGDPIDLTGTTVAFTLTALGETTPTIEGDETGPDAAALDATGEVEYAWTADETADLLGHYRAEHAVTFANGLTRRFPTVGFERVYFYAALDSAS